MTVPSNIDEVSKEFYQRTQKVSVNRWDVPYGGTEVVGVTKAKGDFLIGSDGKKFLDWNNGILCKVFAYGDKEMEKIICGQVKSGVVHTSSVYLNDAAIKFKEAAAGALSNFGDYVILPASSGTIADSMALRIAVANVQAKNSNAKIYFVIPRFGYSGADLHANARCGLGDWCGASTPKFDGIKFIGSEFSDLSPYDPSLNVPAEKVEQWFSDNIDRDGAIPIVLSEAGTLGLGGFRMMTSEWMRAVTIAAKKRGGHFICDCVQAFPLRTGAGLWGFERWVKSKDDAALPDMITTAKGLGDGLPIALVAIRRELAEKVDGKWFDTFAASPIAASVATEVLRRVQDPAIIANANQRGEQLHQGLVEIQKKYAKRVRAIAGSGLMSGLVLLPENLLRVRAAAQARGLLVAMGSDGTIRIAPHLDTTEKAIDKGLKILRKAVSEVK